MKYGLKENTIAFINQVFSVHPEIERVLIYGSRAKGNFQPGSDIDLALQGEKLTHSILNKISLELDDLLLPYIFDLSLYHHITNPSLLEHIKDVGLVFYERFIPPSENTPR
jgi:predicted nucleotidyltransferase